MTLSDTQLRDLAREHGTPLFIYDKTELTERAKHLASLQLPYGFTPRFAVKANTHPAIINLFQDQGLSFDTSSSYEAMKLIEMGVDPTRISLSSQQPAHNLAELLDMGVHYTATSMHQLKLFIEAAKPGARLGLRVNPGVGSGQNNRTTTGGTNSSFGLWHEYVSDALAIVSETKFSITTLHVHIGSGADRTKWGQVMDTCLGLLSSMPDITTLNIGGGYKIHRYEGEHEADMHEIASVFAEKLREYVQSSGREIHLEVEPGTWLVGHSGVLLSEIVDIVDTGADGHTFLRLNTGMNDIIRPSMYGAQHGIAILNDENETQDYVVVGHNCETGDILSPITGDAEGIEPRTLKKASIGDALAVYDAGAYCASFSAKGYNSYPDAAEIFV